MDMHHSDVKSPAKTEAVYTVLLNEIDHPLPLTVLRNGQPVNSSTPDLPLLLRPLALEYAHYSFLLANHFTQLLDKGTFTWPLLVREGDALAAVQIERELRQGILHFDLRPEGLLIRRLLDDGSSVSRRTLRIRDWLADFATKRLVRLTSSNWHLWDKIIMEGTLQVDGSCLIDPQRFSGIELLAAAGQAPPLEDLSLAIAGRAQPPEQRLLDDYKIDVILDATDSEQLFIHAVTQTANRLFPLDQHALHGGGRQTFVPKDDRQRR